jgi:hypothetical protein
MNLRLLSRKTLSDIPSASGIEWVKDTLFVMGDNSPSLFKLNERFEVEEKIPIAANILSAGNTIPKALKPDFEAMAYWEQEKKSELWLFGSGSKSPERDVLVRCLACPPYVVTKYSLLAFYEELRKATGLQKEEFNIEAAVIVKQEFFLFNRGKNIIMRMNVDDFMAYIENWCSMPALAFYTFTLPALNGIEAGFSGAAVLPNSNQIVFTASIEHTANWMDDGEIMGSFIGIVSISELNDLLEPCCQVLRDGENNLLKIKIESVAVHPTSSTNRCRLLLVSDSDGGSSELIEAELSF